MAKKVVNIHLFEANAIHANWLCASIAACNPQWQVSCHDKLPSKKNVLTKLSKCHLVMLADKQLNALMKLLNDTYQSQQAPFPILVLRDDFQVAEGNAHKAWTVEYLAKPAITLPLLKHAIQSAIRDYRKTQALEKLAHFDALTGAANRYLFADRLKQSLIRSKRYQEPLALMYFDLDKFKLINDNYGHDAGDDYLIRFASVVQSCIRESDTLGRLGGDEFAVVLNHADAETAEFIAQKILTELSEPYPIKEHSLAIRTSIGIAQRSGAESAEQLLPSVVMAEADQAVYAAKHEGRNQYCFYQTE